MNLSKVFPETSSVQKLISFVSLAIAFCLGLNSAAIAEINGLKGAETYQIGYVEINKNLCGVEQDTVLRLMHEATALHGLKPNFHKSPDLTINIYIFQGIGNKQDCDFSTILEFKHDIGNAETQFSGFAGPASVLLGKKIFNISLNKQEAAEIYPAVIFQELYELFK